MWSDAAFAVMVGAATESSITSISSMLRILFIGVFLLYFLASFRCHKYK